MKTLKLLSGPAGQARRRRLLLALLLLAVPAGLLAWWAAQGWQGQGGEPAGEWVVVQPQSLAQTLAAEGPLGAASAVNIGAPFDGRILQRRVQPGDVVKAGDLLVQMDAAEVLADLREAQAARIRAREALAELQHWPASTEVVGAQRQVAAGRAQAETARGRLAETQALFDKGIVARSDVDMAQSELNTATEQWHAAQDGLASVLRKGSAAQLQAARLDVQLNDARAALIQARLDQARIVAPQGGVVLAPPPDPAAPGAGPRELEAGSMVSAKDVLMSIGDTSMFMVRAQLDEFDAVRVHPGLAVQVTLGTDESVALRGELLRVSAQGRRDSGQGGTGGAPMFDIQVLVRQVEPAVRPRLRLGMTARLRMVVEPEAAALTVPLAAVRMDAEGHPRVLRRPAAAPQAGPGEDVPIQSGPTLADRVVVRQGLAAGDVVWVPSQPAPPGDEPAGQGDDTGAQGDGPASSMGLGGRP
ncbi:MAG TPA: HlyD family efflux transporter periplasmic adaptor subunit [Burkholderiaceae bacterium]|nr:HlyD family efflux transporter periplasmic adaptor subunit [Burkholderiaceae bacterium]